MNIRFRFTVAIAAASLLAAALAGCAATPSADSPSADSSSPAAAPASSSPTPSAPPALSTAGTSLGTVVVNGKGMTVYVFDADAAGATKSACTGGCMAHWPAVDSDSATPTVAGVTGTVATIMGNDGKLQVTLNGHPLYTWFEDKNPGDTTGQGLDKIWWVVGANGTKITG
jgi:predicted lipoprotein with Yx(FWY)xxD motif